MPKLMRVQCLETGRIYDSLTQARIATGIDGKSFWNCFQKSNRTAGGYHWKELPPIKKPAKRKKKKRVYGFQKGIIPDLCLGWNELGEITNNRYTVYFKEAKVGDNEKGIGGRFYIKTVLNAGLEDDKANFSLQLDDVAYKGLIWEESRELSIMKKYYTGVFDDMFQLIKEKL